jgi:hypothetical protein
VFVFKLSGGLETEMDSMRCVLPGVYPSVTLTTGLPDRENLERSIQTAIAFEVFDPGSNRRSAQLYLLGLRNPEDGLAYTNNLLLTLFMSDGSKAETMLDMTGIFSEIFEQHKGALPPIVYIAVELESLASGVSGEIKGWGRSAIDIDILIE